MRNKFAMVVTLADGQRRVYRTTSEGGGARAVPALLRRAFADDVWFTTSVRADVYEDSAVGPDGAVAYVRPLWSLRSPLAD